MVPDLRPQLRELKGDAWHPDRDEIIRLILREWLEQYGFIELHELDEGGDTNSGA